MLPRPTRIPELYPLLQDPPFELRDVRSFLFVVPCDRARLDALVARSFAWARPDVEVEAFTGHCLIRLLDGDPIRVETAAAVTTVRFGVPTETELAAYIASGEPLGVAGAFTVDGLGGWFIDGVDGDPSNGVGLSLSLVRRMLNAAGTPVNDLWSGTLRP